MTTHNTQQSTDWRFADLLGTPCNAHDAIGLLIDHDEIQYDVDVAQFRYMEA